MFVSAIDNNIFGSRVRLARCYYSPFVNSYVVCVNFELNCEQSVELPVIVRKMATRMKDNGIGETASGYFSECDKKSNAIRRERPRRRIKPRKCYIEEDWAPLKPKLTSAEGNAFEKLSVSGLSSRPGSKGSPSKPSSYSRSSSTKSSETRTQLRFHELKMAQARKEAEARVLEERR